jgi:hypothetical protein
MLLSSNILGNIAFHSAMNGSDYKPKYVRRALKWKIDDQNPVIVEDSLKLKTTDLKTFKKYFE